MTCVSMAGKVTAEWRRLAGGGLFLYPEPFAFYVAGFFFIFYAFMPVREIFSGTAGCRPGAFCGGGGEILGVFAFRQGAFFVSAGNAD